MTTAACITADTVPTTATIMGPGGTVSVDMGASMGIGEYITGAGDSIAGDIEPAGGRVEYRDPILEPR